MSGPLFAWPAQAFYGGVLPKSKLYERARVATRVRDLFVSQVERIVWQYKLAPETINLAAKPGVPEIQIFAVQLKTPELNHDVLRCIDGVVQFPVLFELSHGHGDQLRTQMVAAYKRPNESDASRWVLSDYFATGWRPAAAPRVSMPLALDLAGLYEALLRSLIPLCSRAQEPLSDLVARVELAETKRREVEKTEIRLAREKQFNRKVEINAALRQQKTELDELKK